MLDFDSPLPLYHQLTEILRLQIEANEIAYGEKLESEAEMMKRYGIGRLTVRSALSQLVNMGYLKKVHGKGTFCSYVTQVPDRLHIDVLLDIEDTYFIPYYLKSIAHVFNQEGCNMVVNDTKDSSDVITALLATILQKGSDGIILQPTHDGLLTDELKQCFQQIERAGIPLVMIDSAYDIEGASSLRLDEIQGGRMAAMYLLRLNHTHAAVAYHEQFRDSQQRREGFLSVYREKGMPQPLQFNDSDGRFEQLLACAAESKFSAVFCYNDEMAVELIHLLKMHGFAVPEDISVMGFDDSVLASAVHPALSSISHPKQGLGEESARVLIGFIRKQLDKPYQRLFAPELVERQSCIPV